MLFICRQEAGRRQVRPGVTGECGHWRVVSDPEPDYIYLAAMLVMDISICVTSA